MVSDLKKIIYNIKNIKKNIKELSKKNMKFHEKSNISIIKKILDDR